MERDVDAEAGRRLDRRAALRLVGLGAGAALAGCLGGGDDDDTGTPAGTPTETPAPGSSVADRETTPLAVRNGAEWSETDAGGHVVVADSERRARSALVRYDLPEERREAVESFLADVDYERDRVVVVESVGPDGCHDELEVDEVRLEDGLLRASATALDTSEGEMGCTDAVVYPSSLLRVRFDGEPVDEAAVDVTDGWGETATVTAAADDPLPSPDLADLPGYVRPESDPEPVAPLSCEEDVRRHDQWYDESEVQWGDFGRGGEPALSLRVDSLEYEYGDTLAVSLTNVAGEPVDTGNDAKYNLQVHTEEGWQDVRVLPGDGEFGYTDEAVVHAPGEGFDWRIELTEEGVADAAFHGDARVCPDLGGGRYRFAYFGVIGDGAVAVSFDLT